MIVICSVPAFAAGIVKGRITDQNNRPVEFATAALINPRTKLAVKGAQSNNAGDFVIDGVTAGKYILSVSMLGYGKSETEEFVLADTKEVEKNVVLRESTQQLKEATVVAKRKFIEQQADKLVINPEASITTASENVFDILKKTPGVTVDSNNNISLKGKEGVKIMIDDKPTYVSADQLATMLKGMQGKDIERIEVIENPSARFDAEGNSGIINIKTKHVKRTGFNGSVFTGMSVNSKIGENGGLDLNLNAGKFNIYGNYSFYEWRGWNNNDVSRRYVTGDNIGATQTVNTHDRYHGNGHNYKVGADYFIAKNQVFSVMVRGSNGYNNNYDNSVTNFRNSQAQLDSALLTLSGNHNRWNNQTYNANYKWDIDTTGRSLTIDADYARFSFDTHNNQNGSFRNADGSPKGIETQITGLQQSAIDIFTAKADYVHPFGKKFTLEAGLKTSFVKNDSKADFAVVDPTSTIWNTGLIPHDHFIYDENINAAYMSGRGQFGKTSLQLGLRVENTNSKGDSQSMDRVDRKHYTELFPSLFVQQALNDNNQIGFNYSYRIGRPSYHILNPFKWMLDQYTFEQGNPFLRPQFTHSLGLNYTYKSRFITSLGFNSTNDLFTQVLKQDDQTKVMYQTNDNLSKSIDLNASQTVQLDLAKWWHFNATGTLMYKKVTSDAAGALTFSRWSYLANTTQSFTLPADISMELSGRYQSRQLWGNFIIYSSYSVDLGLQKYILNKQGTLKVSVDDIFNTNNGGGYAKYGNIDLAAKGNWSSRSLNISFTYRFGKDTFKTRSNRATASSEEQNRSGNGR
jgi:hypothetical protein